MTYEEIETIYDSLTNEEKIKHYLVEDSEDNIYLIPSDMLDMFNFLDGLIVDLYKSAGRADLIEVWNYIFEGYDVS
jgi:uncharacterized protein YehS (DUF1456 family)